MAETKRNEIIVADATIKVLSIEGEDYICLTDMVRDRGGEQILYNWLRNRNTIEFLGIWETLYNPEFKPLEFERFKKQAGLNSFYLTTKKWIDSTNAVGLTSKAGRYGGGTFAHKDIAFEFGSWLSPEFKLLIIKEFQRLKQKEQELEQWDYRRFLSKVNYKLQTDAVKTTLVPLAQLPKSREGLLYAEEAEIVNLALFGMTSKEWRMANPELAKKGNVRDYATIEQLTILSNLESANSMFISEGMGKEERYTRLQSEAARQQIALTTSRARLMPPSNARLDLQS